MHDRGKNAIEFGRWDGTPTWEYPIDMEMTIIDAQFDSLSENDPMFDEMKKYGLRSCNHPYTSDTTISGNASIIGSCTWSGLHVTINGYLYISSGNSLTVETVDDDSATLEITGSDGTGRSIILSGTLNLKAEDSGYDVHVWVDQDSTIDVYNGGLLNAEADTNQYGIVYFWGGNSWTDWKGIKLNEGADIQFDGTGTADWYNVRMYNVDDSYSNIRYYSGSNGYVGKLLIDGASFSSGEKGIMMRDTIYPTNTQQFSVDIQIKNSSFTNLDSPIFLNDILVDESIIIDDNSIDGAAATSNAIEMTGVETSEYILIRYNDIDDVTSAIELDNVTYGSGYSIDFISNTIGSSSNYVDYGIEMRNIQVDVSSGGACDIYFSSNLIYANEEGLDYYPMDNHDACSSNDEFIVRYNTVRRAETSSSISTYGIKVWDFYNETAYDNDNYSYYVRNNDVSGFRTNVFMSHSFQSRLEGVNAWSNEFDFDNLTPATSSTPVHLVINSYDHDIYKNTFGDADSYNGIYMTANGSGTCDDNTFAGSGSINGTAGHTVSSCE